MSGKLWKIAKAIPVARLIAAGQIVLMARRHWHRLDRAERRRLLVLVGHSHGRPRNLSQRERAELARLVAKADPRLFASLVAQRFSPVPLPDWLVRGRRP